MISMDGNGLDPDLRPDHMFDGREIFAGQPPMCDDDDTNHPLSLFSLTQIKLPMPN